MFEGLFQPMHLLVTESLSSYSAPRNCLSWEKELETASADSSRR